MPSWSTRRSPSVLPSLDSGIPHSLAIRIGTLLGIVVDSPEMLRHLLVELVTFRAHSGFSYFSRHFQTYSCRDYLRMGRLFKTIPVLYTCTDNEMFGVQLQTRLKHMSKLVKSYRELIKSNPNYTIHTNRFL